MCKRFIVIIFILLAFLMPLFADDECDQSLKDAKTLYNAGKYAEAKELFVYVQQICSPTYGSANTWVQKCNQAMNGGLKQNSQKSSTSASTLSANKTQVSFLEGGGSDVISISSNKNWRVTTIPDTWCQYSVNSSGITLTASANPATSPRSTYILITTIDGKKNITINISQEAKQKTTSTGSSNSSAATLSLGKTYITASAAGATEYITVTCDRNWEVQYPSASMYSVTKVSNTSIRVVINRNSGGSRQDFFNIKTIDGSKTVKVNLSQSGAKGSSTYKNTTNHYSNHNYSALSDFNDSHGKCEVDWFGMRAGIGTGIETDFSLFAFRYSILKIEPVIMGFKYDFIEGYGSFYYQPDIKLVFPWNSDCAVEFGIGPSIQVPFANEKTAVWFTTELGILYHWGDLCSSDFFMRYDGVFSVGVSINLSTGF